ncbi:hypothetical protein AAFF_G00142790 [Aldrovandia affinis]|uniref:Uncharacterized protein n=1 Tax=Aldrovandia affinis TaxID=143900 RepID=A0AAD7T1A7_9TELE|nr:hypothetical protein AAFF_G00142790 [Aldrovandia affinis]
MTTVTASLLIVAVDTHLSTATDLLIIAETYYRGPKLTIPDFVNEDPREFAWLKVALDNILPNDSTEHFKFQILEEHLKFEEALLVADSYSNSRYLYSYAIESLTELYGQPQKFALWLISELMDSPSIRSGEIKAFRRFALRVRALVGMLEQLGRDGYTELRCGSHVSCLLAKLPHDLRASFMRFVNPLKMPIPTLIHLADWLEYEVRVQEDSIPFSGGQGKEYPSLRNEQHKGTKFFPKTATVLHGGEQRQGKAEDPVQTQPPEKKSREKPSKYCPYCNTTQHYTNQCTNFQLLTKEQKETWIKTNQRCWKYGREHLAAQCTLKAKCKKCETKHL